MPENVRVAEEVILKIMRELINHKKLQTLQNVRSKDDREINYKSIISNFTNEDFESIFKQLNLKTPDYSYHDFLKILGGLLQVPNYLFHDDDEPAFGMSFAVVCLITCTVLLVIGISIIKNYGGDPDSIKYGTKLIISGVLILCSPLIIKGLANAGEKMNNILDYYKEEDFIKQNVARLLKDWNIDDIKSIDDVSMKLINILKTPEVHTTEGLAHAHAQAKAVSPPSSLKILLLNSIDLIKKSLPEKDQEILQKAEQVIKDDSYRNINNIDELKSVVLDNNPGSFSTY